MSAESEREWSTRDWSAIHDHMPGPNKQWATRVEGTVTTPTSGWAAELRRHEPQGINPWDFLLDLIVTPPSGSSSDVITDTPVELDEPGKYEYVTVTVIGEAVIKVEHPQ